MEFKNVVNNRRSIRKFKPGVEIPAADLEEIVRMGMQAPNMANRKPWEFYIITNRDILEKIVIEHAPGAGWSRASALIVLCACPDLQKPLPENFMWLDCAAAQSYMLLAAANLGYGSCWVGLYPDERKAQMVKDLLKCESVPFSAAVIGIPDEDVRPREEADVERIHLVK
ncbi:MAG: nitroreductase family protein [Clostridiales bacterium]|nr:nitroreductase family protein [Clostridiales bacterium]